MARPGITQEEVFQAANEMLGQGISPTIELIRQKLQTGSNSTISNYLRVWRKLQGSKIDMAFHSSLPHEAVAMINGLWDRLRQLAEERCTQMEADYQQRFKEIQEEAQKYKTNNQKWQQLHNQWVEEKSQLIQVKNTSDEALAQQRDEILNLTATLETNKKELAEKHERIQELHRLHKQTQVNLEHFRESAREQRLLDQQQYERQIQGFQIELKALKDEGAIIREKMIFLKQENQQLQEKCSFEQEAHHSATSLVKELGAQITELEKHKDHYVKSYEYSQTELKTKDIQVIDSQVKLQLLEEQIKSLQGQFQKIEEENKILLNQKWVIAQEKSVLEGQLKEMRQVLDASLS